MSRYPCDDGRKCLVQCPQCVERDEERERLRRPYRTLPDDRPAVTRVTHEEIAAALRSRARDDEGEFEPLTDLLGFSGENKARTVMRAALEAAAHARSGQEGEVERLRASRDEWADLSRKHERQRDAATDRATKAEERVKALEGVLRKCRPFVAHHDQNAIVGFVKPLLAAIDAALLADPTTAGDGAGRAC